MSDEQTTNEQQAPAPTSEPIIERPGSRAIPDATETRRQEITRHPDWFTNGLQKSALMAEMQRLIDPSIAVNDKAKADAFAQKPAVEQRIAKANANPALWDKTDKDHEAARRELRAAIAAADAPKERDALVAGGITAARNIYGLTVPQAITNLGKDAVENYEQNFSPWESDFLMAAREEGLDNKTVGQLRDAGIKLALQVDGAPLSNEIVDAALKPFAGRLTATQAKALKAYWRRIEGGGAA